jgi:hypothetical protein
MTHVFPSGILFARGGSDPEDASSFRFTPSLFQEGGMKDCIFPWQELIKEDL